MDKKILDFIAKERVGVISVLINSGIPHSATVHYSHKENPLKIYIQTSDSTVKAQPFLNGEAGDASMTFGFSEEEWLTLQTRGKIKMLSKEDLNEIYKIHYEKNPESEQYKGPDIVFLEYTPTWLRYTDFNTTPETVIEDGQ